MVDVPGKQINNPAMTSDARGRGPVSLMLALALVVAVAAGCGGGSEPGHPDSGAGGSGSSRPDSGAGGSGHPDTGYGANQPVPATVNCTDFCTRGANCGAQLCDEDSMSTAYTSLVPLVITECESAGCNASVLAQITTANWQCYFQSSCRQVFGANACQIANTSYSCN